MRDPRTPCTIRAWPSKTVRATKKPAESRACLKAEASGMWWHYESVAT